MCGDCADELRAYAENVAAARPFCPACDLNVNACTCELPPHAA